MSHHMTGQGRNQVTLFPEALDDFVNVENPVRVIDVFVDELNLASLGFNKVTPKNKGRPGYHPATMWKLYIYGCLNRVQSSRRLERETQRNVETMWLLERLTPDFKTIADFRKDNGKGIKNACRQFVELCRQMNMFTDAVMAIDSSKFKAVNAKKNNFTPQKAKDLSGFVTTCKKSESIHRRHESWQTMLKPLRRLMLVWLLSLKKLAVLLA
jgi:transposase